jgi:hypothetical protein
MASNQFFAQMNGAAAGTPTRGLTAVSGITSANWKSIDDSTTAYTAAPVTGGTNSYDVFVFSVWGQSFNQLLNCRFNHVSGVLGAGLSIFATVSGSGFYTTPTQSSNGNLVRDLTSTGLVNTGLVIPFLTTGAWNNDYALTSTGSDRGTGYSPFIITQLRTTAAAAPGDITACVFQLQWDEN